MELAELNKKIKKERSEEAAVPAKGEVMGGHSKVCITTWESRGVKRSLNIRFGAAQGEQDLTN